ncbi:hypothetical protein ZHAS_00016064 [Anopheles sinensis]|uniref:Uncharacterized protein n=1 Tax=Anopheles sinensis TaxID=74873 RepID=A0A084WCZ7_ANOSI|nr:hypothetical protein ZHAS_00016064 [Anopheles sinensis]
MSDEGLQPEEELTLEGAWVFIDDDGSDVSDEVEEAEEMVETDEVGDNSSVTGESANEDLATEETAEESSDHEAEEHNEEDDDSEGDQGETNDNSEEEQNVVNVKKKSKAARVVKGLKKLMGGVFWPSGMS